MEIIGRRLTRDQCKQDGTDREINESELDEGFQLVITCARKPGTLGGQCRLTFGRGTRINHPNATECRRSNLKP